MNSRRCSGGFIDYVKEYLSKHVEIVKHNYDTLIQLKLDRHFVNVEQRFVFNRVYIWVEHSTAYALAPCRFCARIPPHVGYIFSLTNVTEHDFNSNEYCYYSLLDSCVDVYAYFECNENQNIIQVT